MAFTQHAGTGTGYGVYGTITGHGNTGYAGYFINTDTSSNTITASMAFVNSTGTQPVAGVYGEVLITVIAARRIGVNSRNSDVGVNGISGAGRCYGVYGNMLAPATAYGVYGTITGHSNTGYAGYFTQHRHRLRLKAGYRRALSVLSAGNAAATRPFNCQAATAPAASFFRPTAPASPRGFPTPAPPARRSRALRRPPPRTRSTT